MESKTIKSACPAGSANAPREKTDTLFSDPDIIVKFNGIVDTTMRFVQEFQMLSPERWANFVNQFKTNADEKNGGWRGEFWGKMMRGAAFVYTYTRDPALYKILTDSVNDMLTAESKDGRISTFSPSYEFTAWDIWCRKYVLLGMQYYMEICGDDNLKARIIASMCAQADYLIAHLGSAEEGKKPITEASNCWRGLNSSSILEPIVRLYNLTGNKKYLDFASYIVREGGITGETDIFDLAYRDELLPYQYPVTKAYEMMSCFEGLLEYYRVTGIEKHKIAVLNFGRRLMETDITIIGCSGCTHELLDHSAVRQTTTDYQGVMQETCVTVTWMKFCWQLLLISGEAKFADQIELSLYNAFMGSVNTEKKINRKLNGNAQLKLEPLPFDSYSPLIPGIRGAGIGGYQVMEGNTYYGCCACIGGAGIGIIPKTAVMLTATGLCLNFLISGTVKTRMPDGTAVTLTIETDYPVSGKADVLVNCVGSFDLSLRIPGWSEKNEIDYNGEKIFPVPGYTVLHGVNNGAKISVSLDMRTHVLHPIAYGHDTLRNNVDWGHNKVLSVDVTEDPNAKYHIALQRGPIILARDARLDGTVDEAVNVKEDANGCIDPIMLDKAAVSYPCILAMKVARSDGGSFTVTDYGSTGKTWDVESKCAAWLPTKKYWDK